MRFLADMGVSLRVVEWLRAAGHDVIHRDQPMSSADEIEPYVAYQVEGDKMDFALWPLEGGGRALALFLTADAARGYVDRAQLRGDWRIVRPAKSDLLKILEECWEAGVLKAVLDTGGEGRQILFDIFEVLAASKQAGQ